MCLKNPLNYAHDTLHTVWVQSKDDLINFSQHMTTNSFLGFHLLSAHSNFDGWVKLFLLEGLRPLGWNLAFQTWLQDIQWSPKDVNAAMKITF